jgi:hypothetical protein
MQASLSSRLTMQTLSKQHTSILLNARMYLVWYMFSSHLIASHNFAIIMLFRPLKPLFHPSPVFQ